MGEIPVKIKILDREYTIRVNEGEEDTIKDIGKAINDAIQEKRQVMRIFDKQDLLAFVAFDCMFDKILYEKKEAEHIQKIRKLENLITKSFGDNSD